MRIQGTAEKGAAVVEMRNSRKGYIVEKAGRGYIGSGNGEEQADVTGETAAWFSDKHQCGGELSQK